MVHALLSPCYHGRLCLSKQSRQTKGDSYAAACRLLLTTVNSWFCRDVHSMPPTSRLSRRGHLDVLPTAGVNLQARTYQVANSMMARATEHMIPHSEPSRAELETFEG